MKWVVVKVGGEVAARPEALATLAEDVGGLASRGLTPCLVHGAGPQATALSRRLGVTPRVVGGRRITDRETLEVMKMAQAGAVNLDIVSAFTRAGSQPVGLAGPSALLIAAHRRPPVRVSGAGDEPIDFGHVGDVEGVNRGLLELLAGGGYLPVVASLGGGSDGAIYNINADIVAARVALELGAVRLYLVTGAPGVLADPSNPSSRIPRMRASQARAAIAAGTVTGGMIPKIEESLRVLGRVGAIHIVGAGIAGVLQAEDGEPGAMGTVLLPD